jgi:deoxyribonuclease V
MKIEPLHRWDVSPAEAIRIQHELRSHLRFEGHPGHVETVGGVDVSYDKRNDTLYAAVVVMRLADLEVVETATAVRQATFPYVPGLLSFRESPAVLEALAKITQKPDCLFCDGQGIAHPRRFGIACHLGLLVNLPAVGCAKSLLVGEYREPGSKRGDFEPLWDRGEQVGIILRTKDGVEPVYVSPGYRVSLDQAREIVLKAHGGYRVPEPTRRAHLLVNQLRQVAGADRQPSLWGSS